jgi:hypothetical protein
MRSTTGTVFAVALLGVTGLGCDAPPDVPASEEVQTEQAALVPSFDVFNLKAPSAVETTVHSNPYVFVRRGDGNICLIRLFGGAWSCIGAPAGGTTSGPSVAAMPDATNPLTAPVRWTFLFVRGSAGQIFERRMPHGGSWTNWSTAMWSAPPGGTSSAPVTRNGNYQISLAVRSTGNLIFERETTSFDGVSLPSLGSWKVSAAEQMFSAPSPAVNDFKRDLFAISATSKMRTSFCGFPTCFQSWSTFANNTMDFTSSPSALWYTDAQFNPINAVAAIDTAGRVRVGRFNYSDGSFTGYLDMGLPGGEAADSAPAIVTYLPSAASPMETIVIVKKKNGGYWYRNTKPNQSWVGIGSP